MRERERVSERERERERATCQNSPNIHTSLAPVKRRKLIDSGAIHLIGNLPLLAAEKKRKHKIVSTTAQEQGRNTKCNRGATSDPV